MKITTSAKYSLLMFTFKTACFVGLASLMSKEIDN